MIAEEVKQTIYIAIGLFLAAIVLSFAAYILNLRSDFASVRNEELNTKISAEAYLKYNKYQDELLYGEDVAAVIREFAGTDIAVYVENMTSETGAVQNYYLDKTLYASYPHMASIDWLDRGVGTKLPVGMVLSGGLRRDVTYFSYLVFDEYTDTGVKGAKYSSSYGKAYAEVSGIKIVRVGVGRLKLTNVQGNVDAEKAK